MGDLKEPAEKNTELEIKMANGMFIPSVYYKLGEMNYDQNNYESAIAYFQEIINLEVHPRWNNKAIYYLGLSELYLNNYQKAREHFSQLVKKFKDSKEASEGQYYIGVCYELEGNIEQSNEAFKKFLELYPGHAWAGKVKTKLGQ